MVRWALAHDMTIKHLRQRRCLTTMGTVQTYECLLIFFTPNTARILLKMWQLWKKNTVPQCYIRHETVFRFFKDSVKKSNIVSSNISVLFAFLEQIFTSLKDSCCFFFIVLFVFFWRWPSFHFSHRLFPLFAAWFQRRVKQCIPLYQSVVVSATPVCTVSTDAKLHSVVLVPACDDNKMWSV